MTSTIDRRKMESKYLVKPQDQLFWQRLAIPLQLFGLGFTHWWGLPKQPKIFIIHYYVTIIFPPISLMSQILYFYIHFNEYSLYYLGNIFTVIMVTFMISIKLVCARKASYKKIMKQFLTQLHIYNYEPHSQFIDEMLIQVGRYNRWIAIIMITVVGLDTTLWMIIPIVNNIITGAFTSNGTIKLQTCVYMIMPFDFEYSLRNWGIMHALNVYIAGFGCTLFAFADTIMLCMIIHIIGRFKILKNNFRDLKDNFSNYSNKDITKKLGICIRDHVFIMRYFSDLQDAFGLNVTCYYFFNLIFDALLILELKYGDTSTKIAYILIVIIYVGGLFGLSMIMEEIRIQNDELPDTVYGVPWEDMSIPNQRILLIIIGQVQPTLVFTGFAGLRAGIQPAINIMKSTMSYYVMLKAMVNET